MTVSCEDGNETSDFVKGGAFFIRFSRRTLLPVVGYNDSVIVATELN